MDDGHGAGTEQEISEFFERLGQNVPIKTSGPHRVGSAYTHLKRERELCMQGTIIRPSRKHTLAILSLLGMLNCTPAPTPMVEGKVQVDDLDDLGSADAAVFRSSSVWHST